MERLSFGEENDSVFLQMEETKSQSWGGAVGGCLWGVALWGVLAHSRPVWSRAEPSLFQKS